jgi:hypothetical protein
MYQKNAVWLPFRTPFLSPPIYEYLIYFLFSSPKIGGKTQKVAGFLLK